MFNFDNYSLLMCPAASLVLEFLIATDIFLGLCILGHNCMEYLIQNSLRIGYAASLDNLIHGTNYAGTPVFLNYARKRSLFLCL